MKFLIDIFQHVRIKVEIHKKEKQHPSDLRFQQDTNRDQSRNAKHRNKIKIGGINSFIIVANQ